MKKILFVFAIVFSFIWMACNKDDDNSNCSKLEGSWIGESWIEDGVQFFGSTNFITSSNIAFEDLIDGQGDFEWNIGYSIGGTETVMGTYTVNDSCNEVTMTPKGGGPSSVYNFSFDGDVLTLHGIINTIDTELKFRKE